jgi:DNA repair protein RadC
MRKTRLGHVRIRTDELAPYGDATECKSCDPLIPRRAIRVCVTRPQHPGKQLRTAEDVCEVLKNAKHADRESLYVLHLDVKNRIIGVEEAGRGGLSSVEIHPRDIFKAALLTNAASIILAHNHPSGEIDFSEADLSLSRRLKAAGDLIGVPLRDHVIVAINGCGALSKRWPNMLTGAHLRRRRSR